MDLIEKLVELIMKNKKGIKKPYGIVRTLLSSQNVAIELVDCTCSDGRHFHKESSKKYLITRGTGKLVIGNEVHKARKGHSFKIEKGTEHFWQEWSADLQFIVVATPPIHPGDFQLVWKKHITHNT